MQNEVETDSTSSTNPASATSEHSTRRFDLLADLNLLGVAVIWGFNMAIMKFALGRVDPYLFNAMRLTLSSLVLGLCVLWSRRRGESAKPAGSIFNRKHAALVLLFAFLTGFAYQVLFLIGINSTSAGNTALIMSAIPVWTAILAFALIGERLTSRGWWGLMIAVIGVVVVTIYKPESGDQGVGSLTGNIFVSVAAFSWALGSVLSRPLMKSTSPLMLALISVAAMVPLHWLIAFQAWDQVSYLATDSWLLWSLLYSGVFSTGLAYAMWNYGVFQLGVSHAAGFQNLVPLVALFACWWLIGEVPFWLQLVGGALILTGLVTLRSQRSPQDLVVDKK